MIEILEKQLKKEEYNNLYLFYGEEYLKKYYESKYKAAILKNSLEDMNLNIIEGKTTIKEIADKANQVPFMSPYRLVLVRNSGFFAKSGTDMESLSELTSTIIIFTEKEVDKRVGAYKTLAKKGLAVEMKIPKENELVNWLGDFFKDNKTAIKKSDIIYLLQITPPDMQMIKKEAEKLASHGEITREVIDQLVTKSPDLKIFDMLKFLGQKDVKKALQIYNNMLDNRTEPLMILAMIIRQFRLILRVKALSHSGVPLDNIVSKLKSRSFIVRECLAQSKNFKFNTLIQALEDCLNTDIAIKTGKISPPLGVELLIVKYGSSDI